MNINHKILPIVIFIFISYSSCHAFTIYINTVDEYKEAILRKLDVGILPEKDTFCPHPNISLGDDFIPLVIEDKYNNRKYVKQEFLSITYRYEISYRNEPEKYCDAVLSALESYIRTMNIGLKKKILKIF